jgi:hypothetical protein
VSFVWRLHIFFVQKLIFVGVFFCGVGGLAAVFCRLGGFMGQSLRIF